MDLAIFFDHATQSKAESEEVIRRKRAKQKEKRQAAKQDVHYRGLTDEEKRIALGLLEVRPSKVDKRSGGQLLDQRQVRTRKKKSMTHETSLTTPIGCMNILWPKGARLVAMLLFCCRTCNNSKQAVNTRIRVLAPCSCALLHAPWP